MSTPSSSSHHGTTGQEARGICNDIPGVTSIYSIADYRREYTLLRVQDPNWDPLHDESLVDPGPIPRLHPLRYAYDRPSNVVQAWCAAKADRTCQIDPRFRYHRYRTAHNWLPIYEVHIDEREDGRSPTQMTRSLCCQIKWGKPAQPHMWTEKSDFLRAFPSDKWIIRLAMQGDRADHWALFKRQQEPLLENLRPPRTMMSFLGV